MRIKEMISRHRNDFHWIGHCKHCGKDSRHGDGYADDFYCTQVVPNRCCPECGLSEYGETYDQQQARFKAAAEAKQQGAAP